MIGLESSGVADRRRTAIADQALAYALALARDLHDIVQSDPLAGRHAPQLRRLARQSDAVGLSCLGEAARLTLAALATPRRQDALVSHAIDVLTLAGEAVKRGDPVCADLHPAVEALRDHLRYAGAASSHE